MVCGPDILHLLDVADRTLQRHTAYAPPPTLARRVSGGDAWRQLLDLYEQGSIDEATFQQLKPLAERGQLRPVDVAVLQYEARHHGKRLRPSVEEEEALRLLKARRARLLAARRTSEQTLNKVEQQIADLEKRIQEKEGTARAVVVRDEEQARQLLHEKHLFEESKARLEEQARALREDIQALDDVVAQVDAKIVELEAMQSRASIYTVRQQSGEKE